VLACTREKAPSSPPISAHLAGRIQREFTTRWDTLWSGRSLLHGREAGCGAVRLNGNDYLSLTGHADIVQAQTLAIKTDAEFVIQSGVFLLDEHPARKLELKLARMLGQEDGLICQSGYAANLGLLQSIADEKTVIYMDSLAHTSLWEGARRAGATTHPFRHNDAGHLERLVQRHGAGVIVVDSIYSTTGAVAPLVQVVEVAERWGCMTLVDESHSLGTHGPQGAGLCAELGLSHRVHFITASLAKAFAGRAGFLSLPAAMRNYVLSTSYPNMFSSCLLPHEIAALDAACRPTRASCAACSATWVTRSTKARSRSLPWKPAPNRPPWCCATCWRSAMCSARCSARRPPAATAPWCDSRCTPRSPRPSSTT